MDMTLVKIEINRYLRIGVDKSDIALMIASWGLTPEDLEKANWELHDAVRRDNKGRFAKGAEGIVL